MLQSKGEVKADGMGFVTLQAFCGRNPLPLKSNPKPLVQKEN